MFVEPEDELGQTILGHPGQPLERVVCSKRQSESGGKSGIGQGRGMHPELLVEVDEVLDVDDVEQPHFLL